MFLSDPKQNPNVEKFKQFVQQHPGLIKEVRRGTHKWQDFYEQWTLLGEEDPSWEAYLQDKTNQSEESTSTTKKKSKQDWMKQVTGMMDKVDMNKMEGHIEQLNGAITNIQSLLAQFQDVKKQTPTKPSTPPSRRPFQFHRD